jgi:hypothetical protein
MIWRGSFGFPVRVEKMKSSGPVRGAIFRQSDRSSTAGLESGIRRMLLSVFGLSITRS